MRLRNISTIILTICSTLAITSSAAAQIPVSGAGGTVPTFRPSFSPYLNLLRSGSSPALNYYGIVRPELNAIGAINNLRQQQFTEQQSINDLQSQSALPTTGFAAQFLNLGGYFQSRGGSGVSTFLQGGANQGGMGGGANSRPSR